MEIYHVGKGESKHITQFHSDFYMSRITETENPTHIVCMHLEEKGVIGYHQAVADQLLFIVNGEGFVRGNADESVKVHRGDAVYWKKGEWHETKTDTGLTAIVIESEAIDISSFMHPGKEG